MTLSLADTLELLADSRKELERIQEKQRKWREHGFQVGAEIRRLEIEVERLSLPAEPTAEGAIVRFRKSFCGNAKVYSYAAIRTNGRWYTTGVLPPQGITWEQLCAFAKENNVLVEAPREVDDARPPF